MSVLDRVLSSPRWEHFYKRTSCETLIRVGSDHCPLLITTDDHKFKQQHCFRFEMAWLTQEGFRERVTNSWPERGDKNVQDFWRDLKADTRRFCKGWDANRNSGIKREKRIFLSEVKEMDKMEEDNASTQHNGRKDMVWKDN
jgi:exonuclease III